MTSGAPRDRSAHLPGLDGLRALAVGAVVLFHVAPAALPGGYLGVDVFFVISGFLITTLLMRERDGDGIRLGRFLLRRARRLLPALAVVVIGCAALAAVIGGDVLVGIGAELLGALTFSSNWVAVAQGDDYFAAAAPQLLRNLWSLGVEEQYYLLWPILLAVVCLLRPPARRGTVVLAAAALSALAMALLALLSGPARAYYGTDTHVFGLLAGSALALGVLPAGGIGVGTAVERLRGAAGHWIGGAALVGLVAAAFLLDEHSLTPYLGGLAIVAALATTVVWAATAPGSWLGRVLDMRPLRYLGERSYGIYLWHWPLLVLVGAIVPTWRQDPAASWLVPLLVVGLTLLLAALSYRFLEQPVRRLGFGGAARALLPRRVPLAVVAALALVAVSLSVVGVVRAPASTEAEGLIAAGSAAIEETTPEHPVAPVEDDGPTAADAMGNGDGATEGAPTDSADEAAAPLSGDRITAIGDSVMLAAAPALQAELPDISIDAAVSRQLAEAPALLARAEAAGTLRPVVVIGLATNGPTGWRYLEQVRDSAAGRKLVFVNAYGPMEWTGSVNQTLADFVAQTPGAVVADWNSAAAAHPELLASDQTHPGADAAVLYADCVTAAIRRL
ncbi:acyltransferase family protein [Herbiconiux sp. L3-i23]|uniref:acyltransferase family protein n=1 Tax=Herbiconiux sp. L3-i23 TaxID=2905871 RepID=UPI002073FAC7|nr:acyltransferase family protein [Herbiconiux sp. L3-i23]